MDRQMGGSTPEHEREIAHLRLRPADAASIELGRLRASGSYGSVYEVEGSSLKEKRKMVVKVFASRANRQASTANEVFNCQRAAELVPTRTSEVVGFTEELAGAKGSCAIVFIDGGRDLESLWRTADDGDWASYMKQALCIVMALHRKGISHGDVKLGNLVVDGKGKVTLIDFGSATFANEPGGWSPTSKGPTERYWCPISRASSMMSNVIGISHPGFDGTQDGFLADSYSIAVSFGAKYGLCVNGISGVRVPSIGELDDGHCAENLENVLRRLTGKAFERWDIEHVQSSSWWKEIGDKFCVDVPEITDAEKLRAKGGGLVDVTDGREKPSTPAMVVEEGTQEGDQEVTRKRYRGAATSRLESGSLPAPRREGEGGGKSSAVVVAAAAAARTTRRITVSPSPMNNQAKEELDAPTGVAQKIELPQEVASSSVSTDSPAVVTPSPPKSVGPRAVPKPARAAGVPVSSVGSSVSDGAVRSPFPGGVLEGQQQSREKRRLPQSSGSCFEPCSRRARVDDDAGRFVGLGAETRDEANGQAE